MIKTLAESKAQLEYQKPKIVDSSFITDVVTLLKYVFIIIIIVTVQKNLNYSDYVLHTSTDEFTFHYVQIKF